MCRYIVFLFLNNTQAAEHRTYDTTSYDRRDYTLVELILELCGHGLPNIDGMIEQASTVVWWICEVSEG